MSKRIRMIDRLQVNYYLAVGFFYGGIFMGSSRLAMLANKSLNISDNIDEKKNYSKEEIIERDLQRDLQNDRFKIYYQSKHDVKSGKIVGAEALVRWDHKELGMLSPMEFIPIFEKNGSIKDLDMIVREKVFSDIERWRNNGYRQIPISINLSRIDFKDFELVNSIFDGVKKYSINPSQICFEITETARIDSREAICRAVYRLRDSGFKVALDDFGSGYSSLSILNEIEFDILKIDKELLKNIEGERERFLIKMCISLGKNYEMITEAEGVETKEQYELLKDIGCNNAQGFYFASALPVETFEMRLKDE